MPWSACVAISFAGRACTSGWRPARAGRCARCARRPSAGTRSSRCTAAGTPSRKTLGTRCPPGRLGSAQSQRTTSGSRASASVKGSTCPSASEHSPSECSRLPSTLETRGLAQLPAAPPNMKKSSSYQKYSCGLRYCSCSGSYSHDRIGSPPPSPARAPPRPVGQPVAGLVGRRYVDSPPDTTACHLFWVNV